MKPYKEFQFGWNIFVILIPTQVLITWIFIERAGDTPLSFNSFLVSQLFFVLIYTLFYGLTVKIDDDILMISYGIGLIRKKIRCNRIMTVRTITNPALYGWGVRFIPNGMLYNVSGSEGVELTFNDSSRIMRIGSDDPAKLKHEIVKRISSSF